MTRLLPDWLLPYYTIMPLLASHALSKKPSRTIDWVVKSKRLVYTGYTLTFLRSRPRRSKRTTPSTLANNVSSLPLPTLVPG